MVQLRQLRHQWIKIKYHNSYIYYHKNSSNSINTSFKTYSLREVQMVKCRRLRRKSSWPYYLKTYQLSIYSKCRPQAHI